MTQKLASPPRLVITGAGGFLGRAILSLTTGDDSVCGIGRRPLPAPDPRYTTETLRHTEDVASFLRPGDVVVHLAAAPVEALPDAAEAETLLAQQLGRAAARAGVRRVVTVGRSGWFSAHKRRRARVIAALAESTTPVTVIAVAAIAGTPTRRERPLFTNTQAFFGGLAESPVGAPFTLLKPVPVDALARLIVDVARQDRPPRVLRGVGLFRLLHKETPQNVLSAADEERG